MGLEVTLAQGEKGEKANIHWVVREGMVTQLWSRTSSLRRTFRNGGKGVERRHAW
jgi:hypothetical protein